MLWIVWVCETIDYSDVGKQLLRELTLVGPAPYIDLFRSQISFVRSQVLQIKFLSNICVPRCIVFVVFILFVLNVYFIQISAVHLCSQNRLSDQSLADAWVQCKTAWTLVGTYGLLEAMC